MQQFLTRVVSYLMTWPYITEGFGDVQVGPTTFSSQELMYILGLCAIMLFLGIIGCCVLKSLIKECEGESKVVDIARWKYLVKSQ